MTSFSRSQGTSESMDVDETANMFHEDPRHPRAPELECQESQKYLVGENITEVEDASPNMAFAGPQSVETVHAAPLQTKTSKPAPQAQDRGARRTPERDKLTRPYGDERRYQSHAGSRTVSVSEERAREAVSEPKPSVHDGSHHPNTRVYLQSREDTTDQRQYLPSSPSPEHRHTYRPQGTRSSGRDGDDSSSPLQPHEKCRRLDARQTHTMSSRMTESVPNAEPRERLDYESESLSRDSSSVGRELQAEILLQGDKDRAITSLKAQIAELQHNYSEQSKMLSSVRQELRSCHSQLDNVQRFISTADAHADQDLIQKLQGINEEIFRTSMTMADYVAENFTRQSPSHTREKTSVREGVRETIGPVMAGCLASAKDEDVALFLQIACQSWLARLVEWVVSSWSDNLGLNALIGETYQRLRKAETQAICGRWRSLTRAYIPPTSVSNLTLQRTITVVSDIVGAAGFAISRSDPESKLSAKFGDKIITIISHAGKFGNMVADMVSGDFEVFTVQPGEKFEGERMMDTNEVRGTPRGTGAAQTVLCMTRVGLRKQMGEKAMILTRAQVVLTSFLE